MSFSRHRPRILITSGPTHEPLDPVRFIANASSGRTGAAIARQALLRGCGVELVCGPSASAPPPGAHLHAVQTAEEMLAVCEKLYDGCDAVIGAAAVCDYRPKEKLAEKKSSGEGHWILELVPNPDILKRLGERKIRKRHIGFALQTGSLEESIREARQKIRLKNLDWIVLNMAQAIGAESARYWILSAAGEITDLGVLDKDSLAARVLDLIMENPSSFQSESSRSSDIEKPC